MQDQDRQNDAEYQRRVAAAIDWEYSLGRKISRRSPQYPVGLKELVEGVYDNPSFVADWIADGALANDRPDGLRDAMLASLARLEREWLARPAMPHALHIKQFDIDKTSPLRNVALAAEGVELTPRQHRTRTSILERVFGDSYTVDGKSNFFAERHGNGALLQIKETTGNILRSMPFVFGGIHTPVYPATARQYLDGITKATGFDDQVALIAANGFLEQAGARLTNRIQALHGPIRRTSLGGGLWNLFIEREGADTHDRAAWWVSPELHDYCHRELDGLADLHEHPDFFHGDGRIFGPRGLEALEALLLCHSVVARTLGYIYEHHTPDGLKERIAPEMDGVISAITNAKADALYPSDDPRARRSITAGKRFGVTRRRPVKFPAMPDTDITGKPDTDSAERDAPTLRYRRHRRSTRPQTGPETPASTDGFPPPDFRERASNDVRPPSTPSLPPPDAGPHRRNPGPTPPAR